MVGFKAKVILAGTPHPPQSLLKKMEAANKRLAQSIRDDYAKTVRTWEKKPKFKIVRVRDPSGAIIFEVSTDNEIYGYVDKGTEPHVIRPKPDNPTGFLWFKAPSNAKTTPNVLGSFKGGLASGARLFRAQEVNHPGTRPRNFTKMIKARFRLKVIAENNKLLREWTQTLTPPTKG